jgi:hypothetical protein
MRHTNGSSKNLSSIIRTVLLEEDEHLSDDPAVPTPYDEFLANLSAGRASRQEIDSAAEAAIAAYTHPDHMLKSVGANFSSPTWVSDMAAARAAPKVLASIAASPQTSSKTLEKIGSSMWNFGGSMAEYSRVKSIILAVAEHPNTPDRVRLLFLGEHSLGPLDEILVAVLARVPASVRKKYFFHKPYKTYLIDVLEKQLYPDENSWVRHLRMSSEDGLTPDERKLKRASSAGTGKEELYRYGRDYNPYIRDAALANPNYPGAMQRAAHALGIKKLS